MRSYKLTSAALVSILIMSTNAHSASLYYTFEGYIQNFGTDPIGEAKSAGLGLFSSLSYTVEVDFSAAGMRLMQGGSTEYLSDVSGNFYGEYSTDYFYASLVDASHPLLSPARSYTESVGIADDVVENNYGASTTNTSTVIIDGSATSTYTYSGSLRLVDSLTIQSQHKLVQDWVIGDALQGIYTYGDWSNNTYTSFATSLELTNISAVPLPPAIWLFLSGVIALPGLSKRRQM